jgi:transcription initiation factor IIE alpha subunit
MIPDTACEHGRRWSERCLLCDICDQQFAVNEAKAELKKATDKLEALKMERRAEKAGVAA